MSTHFQSRRPMFSRVLFCMIPGMFSLAVTASCLGAVVSIGPLPYLSAADSPLLADPTLDVVLEDFEDGLFNVPGVTTKSFDNSPEPPFVNDGRGIVTGPGTDTDSVDADDGVIDGSGTGGHAFRSTFTVLDLSGTFNNGLSFSIQPKPNGEYPNAVGFVWTDGEPGPNAVVTIGLGEIDDSGAITPHRFTFPTVKGDNVFNGGTNDDKFLGFLSDSGIASFSISSGFDMSSPFDDGSTRQLFFEMDHLQFGFTRVPEPRAILLLAISLSTLLARRTPK